jgi:hypothetical protein
MTKPFSFSWSRLKNWRSCPKRYWEIDVAKNFSEPEADALLWGKQVHDAMAKRIDKGEPLPLTMQHYAEWPQKLVGLKDAGVKVLVENKLAMSQGFTATSFFDAATWFRGVVDVLLLTVRRAGSIDWKTGGSVNPEFEQLGLSAQLIFSHYPEVEAVDSVYVWLGHTHDDGSAVTTKKTYTRDGMVPLWAGLLPEINQLTEAHRTVTFPPKPSGLCVRHCVVTSCPYHGKGNR